MTIPKFALGIWLRQNVYMTAETYRTVTARLRHEGDKIKGSRFITTVSPVTSVEEIPPLIKLLRAEFSAANHHCYAYRLGPGVDNFRYADDGEPSGSAGRPILRQIDGHGLTNVVVIVTRIFGGTKLGVGGLIRAYGCAAGEAIDLAEIRVVIPTRILRITIPYDLSGIMDGILRAEGIEPAESNYDEQIHLTLAIPEDRANVFIEQLRERTAGRAVIET
jgi:uncharacterized YigZ family protein